MLFVGLWLLFGVGLRWVLWLLSCFTFDSWVLDLDCYYLCLLVCGLLIVLFVFYSFYLWLLVCWNRLFSGLVDVVDCGFGVCGCLFVLLHVLCV